MIFVDTDHLSILTNRDAAGHAALHHRLENSTDSPAVPIVCVEEQCKGWLAKIHGTREVHQQISAYERLENLFHFLAEWEIVSLDTTAADAFVRLR